MPYTWDLNLDIVNLFLKLGNRRMGITIYEELNKNREHVIRLMDVLITLQRLADDGYITGEYPDFDLQYALFTLKPEGQDTKPLVSKETNLYSLIKLYPSSTTRELTKLYNTKLEKPLHRTWGDISDILNTMETNGHIERVVTSMVNCWRVL